MEILYIYQLGFHFLNETQNPWLSRITIIVLLCFFKQVYYIKLIALAKKKKNQKIASDLLQV